MKNSFLKYILFIILSIILIFIDQFTKRIATKELLNKKPYVVIDKILEFVYTENRGAAFGILQGRQILFFILTIIIIAILIVMLVKLDFTKNNYLSFLFLLFIFSGAIGNFIDRVKNKYVVDFIYFVPIDFPVFNFADILITCGIIIFIIDSFFIKKEFV